MTMKTRRRYSDGFKAEAVNMVRGEGYTISEATRQLDAKGFTVHPKRWIVKRSLSWIQKARRQVIHYDRRVDAFEPGYGWRLAAYYSTINSYSLKVL